MQGYVIPGFSVYTVDERPEGEWGVRNYLTGRRGVGSGRRELGEFIEPEIDGIIKLRSDEGRWKTRKLSGWLSLAMPRVGLPIPGFDGYTLDRKPDGTWGVRSYKSGRGTRAIPGSFLSSIGGDQERRPSFSLSQTEGGHRSVQLGRVVLLALVGLPPSPDMVCCHRDDDPSDNEIDNLYWGSERQNAVDRVKNGLSFYAAGSENLNAKLTKQEARAIYLAYVRDGISAQAIVDTFFISGPTVNAIVTGKVWAWATEDLRVKFPYTPKWIPQATKEQAMELSREGLTAVRVADELGVSVGTVANVRAELREPDEVLPTKGRLLTAPQVRMIFQRWQNGEDARDLAEEFGVSQQMVSEIASRRSWARETEGMEVRRQSLHRDLSEDDRASLAARAHELREAGLTYQAIADEIDVSIATVWGWLKDTSAPRSVPRRHGNALTVDEVREIFTCWHDGGEQCRALAQKFGVSASMVERIVKGLSWSAETADLPRKRKMEYHIISPEERERLKVKARELVATGMPYRLIASELGVVASTVSLWLRNPTAASA